MIPNFRVYNKTTKLMYPVKFISYPLRTVRCINKHGLYLSEETFYLTREEIVLMQSTGLKDKNGVKIFDGDIVKLQYTIASDFELFEVRQFRGGMWRIDNRRRGSDLWLRNEDCEVIGNIYQNSDLIESVEE
ncbi:YopX family protein [Streptococcus dysgalactiae subsp. equisimilis]|uniref:YopX family protein n=1 Tax=Streptococcus dysgalactiae TaxID=1334 RepID=UPI001F1410FD|nr:YopX family protein [Streptococcus dysgalactiae]MCL6222255.1 YopX family protein [Streptococcus dysgalactiae subsp. equisimilis]UMY67467.1 YopX family protein [Streptococcus dysgalactiae subsp. equisimilis]